MALTQVELDKWEVDVLQMFTIPAADFNNDDSSTYPSRTSGLYARAHAMIQNNRAQLEKHFTRYIGDTVVKQKIWDAYDAYKVAENDNFDDGEDPVSNWFNIDGIILWDDDAVARPTIAANPDDVIRPNSGGRGSSGGRGGGSGGGRGSSAGSGAGSVPWIDSLTFSFTGAIADILVKKCARAHSGYPTSNTRCRAWVHTGAKLDTCKLKQCGRSVDSNNRVLYCFQHRKDLAGKEQKESNINPDDYANRPVHNDNDVRDISDLSKTMEEWAGLIVEAKKYIDSKLIEQLGEWVDTLCVKIKLLQDQLVHANTVQTNNTSQVSGLDAQLLDAQTKIAELQGKLDDLKAQLHDSKTDHIAATVALKSRIEDLEEEIQSLTIERDVLVEERAKCMLNYNMQSKVIVDLQKGLSTLMDKMRDEFDQSTAAGGITELVKKLKDCVSPPIVNP